MGTSDAGDKIEGLDEAKPVSTSLERYADKAMYPAEPMPDKTPTVKLLWMTPDPLGAIAATSGIYDGKVFRSLLDVTDDDRRKYWEAMTKTHLNAPLESVKVHFLIENVDRAFTHQLVRQRTAVYFQESMRFAVKESLADETPYPPSFEDKRIANSPSKKNDLDKIWDDCIEGIEQAYLALIAAGVPAEDARGLLPTATLTRIHYITDLRNLLEHAGNRLCTQAQFHWRTVFMQMRECIRTHWIQMADEDYLNALATPREMTEAVGLEPFQYPKDIARHVYKAWQFELIADTAFKPQCYLQGKCTFKAEFDRGCTIRTRVDELASKGVPSSEWGRGISMTGVPAIREEEWSEDPQAAWVRS